MYMTSQTARSVLHPTITTTRTVVQSHRRGRHVRTQRGFSLIELGLALAVIALIAGGILKGRDMLANARLQNIVSQLGQMEMAITSFETRYGALPGDMSTASTAFGALTSEANGNGNDRIDTAAEAARAFQTLGLAQLVAGQFDGVAPSGNTCPATTCPQTATGGRLMFMTGVQPAGTGSFRALLAPVGQLDPRQLAELDRKIDDGRANTGRFQILANAPEACLSGGNWNMGGTLDTCTGALLVQ